MCSTKLAGFPLAVARNVNVYVPGTLGWPASAAPLMHPLEAAHPVISGSVQMSIPGGRAFDPGASANVHPAAGGALPPTVRISSDRRPLPTQTSDGLAFEMNQVVFDEFTAYRRLN